MWSLGAISREAEKSDADGGGVTEWKENGCIICFHRYSRVTTVRSLWAQTAEKKPASPKQLQSHIKVSYFMPCLSTAIGHEPMGQAF